MSHLGHGQDGRLCSTSNGTHVTREVALVIRLLHLAKHVHLRVDLATAALPVITASLCSATYVLEHSNSGKKSFNSIRFDFRYRIDFFDSIRFGNLINLPLVH